MLRQCRCEWGSIFAAVLLVSGCHDTPSQPTQTYTISGSVGSASEGIVLRVTGPDSGTTETDQNGFFSIGGLRPGDYTVTPTQPLSVFDPVAANITINNMAPAPLTFTRQSPEEGLSESELERLDAEPESSLPEQSVVLSDGQSLADYANSRGLPENPNDPAASVRALTLLAAHSMPNVDPEQRRKDIITLMLRSARDYACGRLPNPCSKWNYAADVIDPQNMPAQTGLTYVYGGKTPLIRTRPTDGCPQATHGMDCQGLILKIAEAAGVTAPAGSAAQSVPSKWNFPKDWELEMRVVTDGTIESGDLVAWPDHIGIAESAGAGLSVNVISSTGGPGLCTSNINPPKGPRSLRISAFPPPTAVLRLISTSQYANRIAYVGPGALGTEDLYTINPDGSGARAVNLPAAIQDGEIDDPAWNPAHTKIAVAAKPPPPNNQDYDIYIVDPSGAALLNLTNTDPGNENDPAFSPDGSRIAYQGDGGGIWVMNADGTDKARITVVGGRPNWSSDGTKIVFDADAGIFTVPATGGVAPQLVHANGSRASWSPDGTRILFSEFDGTQTSLYVMNADGTAVALVAALGRAGAWSPDGSKVAFRADPSNTIYIMGIAGGGATFVVTAFRDGGFTWR